MKRWPALEILVPGPTGGVPADWPDTLAAALDDLAPTAVQEQDDRWRVFFASGGDRDRALEVLEADVPWLAAVSPVDVDDEDWARRSQETLQPVQVGRIVIAPPWAAGRTDPSSLEILILPSMGFGTGHHASTRLCTALLQELDLRGRSVLDVGTGSGVLALVALRLGARTIEALDDDPDAIAAAGENLDLNQVTDGISLRRADFREFESLSADVVTANLTGALLARSAVLLAAAVRAGGSLIVSGVTVEEEPTVAAAFEAHLRPASRMAEEGWVGLRFEKS